MADQEGNEITQAEIDGFIGKLEKWGESLETTDQNILNLVVATAAAGTVAEDEVSGFRFETASSFQQLRGGLAANQIMFPGGGAGAAAGWVQMGTPWVQGAGSFGQLFGR